MEHRLLLEVVTPSRMVVSKVVDIAVAPGVMGEFGVLVSHIPFLTSLQVGEMRYRVGKEEERLFISGGFAEVSNNKMTILADAAEPPEKIDLERARRARERAEKRVAQAAKDEAVDFARAEAALRRAIARISIASKKRM
ncbi:MAG: F0F1 ATP synthase subunit epsilon [Deltaproteobacteria bacterium]|nr:F0F1 ATP synthase subunit epsilon [Deltaproteobacteria bacterium]